MQRFEAMDALDGPLNNEYECPLYELTHIFQRIPSVCVGQAVSFFHECTPSCGFNRMETNTLVERQEVMSSRLVFNHDHSRTLYFHNVYCMPTSHQ